jgi:hypothetical protein
VTVPLALAGASPAVPAVITAFGVVAVVFMVTMYAVESRGRIFTLLFAFGCVLASAYGFLSRAWPFGVVELVWAGLAVRTWAGRK